ncbi:MAG: Asp-tRNA(Asn)/Glu-tRNA(Gln) amidotransferase subunit GatC [Verrucomicrobiae bacterium]|nr:Asp-tRNA(Asn)/Glu-tRNA(Gln) amidotransferase subunit GatC [Verrucomicrobiae bacterium]MCP5541668.1 Asp-tRNA(Asn)/Glu-tRNA(Gln) amidotransferase subunit GatC [Akkermansiaceae bacterium]MCP5549313.1 Asp-tRNA(Asn)/Glu-tRNA(Gln) amidotransferase subunit GatC [Akkermansiaceae bacterium]
MDVRYVARLARLALSEEEVSRYQDQLGHILEHVEQLKGVDVSEIEPTAHASPVFDVMREDAPHGESFTAEEALANAPEVSQGQFRMPKVVE